jgi:hypothetical protein
MSRLLAGWLPTGSRIEVQHLPGDARVAAALETMSSMPLNSMTRRSRPMPVASVACSILDDHYK